jgi:hypothetical protein
MHCYENDERLSWDVQVKGYNVDKLMTEFVETNGKKQIVLIDDVEWPNNTRCATTSTTTTTTTTTATSISTANRRLRLRLRRPRRLQLII